MLQWNVGVSWGELNLLNPPLATKNSRNELSYARQRILAAWLFIALAGGPLTTDSFVAATVNEPYLATNLYQANKHQPMVSSQSVASLFTQLKTQLVAQFFIHSPLYAKKSRYKRGLVCKDKGWEFCATWATSGRAPGSRIA